MKLSASFLSIKDDIKENIEILDKTNISYIHLDIMDGVFVSNKTWSYSEVQSLVIGLSKPLDIHLMVKDVKNYVDRFCLLKPEFITFHYEVCDDIDGMIDYIKEKGIKVGISIKPDTGVYALTPYLNKLDLVLVMTVEPGLGGQVLLENTIVKINELYEIRERNGYNYLIETDGGINDKTIHLLENADICVVGSYITNSNNYEEKVNGLLGKRN